MAVVYDDLASGNSALDPTFGNEDVTDDQIEAVSEQQQLLQELLPGVQYIRDACDDEIEAVSDMRAYMKTLGNKASATDIQDEYRARELYIGFLSRLKDSISDQVAAAEAEANK